MNEVITFEEIAMRMEQYVSEAVEGNPEADYYEIDDIVREWIDSSDWVIYYHKAEQVARVFYEYDMDEYHDTVRAAPDGISSSDLKANLAYSFMYEIASWKLESQFDTNTWGE